MVVMVTRTGVPVRFWAMPRVRTRQVILASALFTATALSGCANPGAGQLLVADTAPKGDSNSVAIYAVDPGDPADDDAVIASQATNRVGVSTIEADGRVWMNSLGRVWDDRLLLAYNDPLGARVTAGLPGGEQTRLAEARQLLARVIRRGAFVQTTEGCQIASSVEEIDQVGTGMCAVSADERWVASWPFEGPGLEIRDLRHDRTEKVDLSVSNAVALGHQARVLAVAAVDDGFQGVLLDGSDGSEISRTDTFQTLDVVPAAPSADGFVLRSGTSDGTALHYMDVDGHLTTIEEGLMVVPVLSGAEITYLSYSGDLSTSALRRWAPGDDEPEDLLTGFVGASSPDGEHIVGTRESSDGTEFFYEDPGTGHMELGYTLKRSAQDSDPASGSGTGVRIPTSVLLGSTVYMQVDGASSSSFVRLSISGGHSDAPIVGAIGLRLESLDADGTALLTRSAAEDASTEIVALRPDDEKPDVRARVEMTGTNLIHDGTIYLTDASDREKLRVRSVRASGKGKDLTELYKDRLIVGATWPEWGGATQVQFLTPSLLLDQLRNQAGSSGATGTTGSTGASNGATTGGGSAG